MGKFKKYIKDLAYSKRHKGLTSNDIVKARQLRKAIIVLALVKKVKALSKERKKKIKKVLQLLLAVYLSVLVESPSPVDPPKPKIPRRTIDSFTEADSRINFRYSKADMRKILTLLKFPEKVAFKSSRHFISGEEVLLRGLYELASGENQHKIAANVFGKDQPFQSRAFKTFIEFVYAEHSHLLSNNLDWWFRNGFFRLSADAIANKIGFADNRIAHFIDCNCLRTRTPGGGPAESGAFAERWSTLIQMAFYNGWKSLHGLKVCQIVVGK
jgi:hypothetical protein